MQSKKKYFHNNWRTLIMVIVGIAMFFVYAWFPYASSQKPFSCDTIDTKTKPSIMLNVQDELCGIYGDPGKIYKFNSPDEMMNYFWSQRLSSDGSLFIEEPLETTGNSLLRPRSVNIVDEKIVPGSFLGLPFIYGGFGKLVQGMGTSPHSFILYLTPFFAIVGILFFYAIIREIFSEDVALVTGLMAYVLPPWMYFSARSMFHNVLFVTLLMIGLYFLVKVLTKRRNDTDMSESFQRSVYYLIAGLSIGLALITRTSELGWVAFTVTILMIVNIRRIYWPGIILFIVAFIVAFIPVFRTNIELYGTPLSIGYSTGIEGDFVSLARKPGLVFSLLVSPFGLDLRSMYINAYAYLGKFFWYFSIPALLGFVSWLFTKNKTKRQITYTGVSLVFSILLIIFYGSWQITDRIDEETVSIGTSYVRYWLPIYLAMLPFIGYLIVRIISFTRRMWARTIIAILLITLIAMPSAQIVFFDTDESLMTVRDTIITTQSKLIKLRNQVPEGAIVVLGYKQADKIAFPEHSRIVSELVVPRDYEAVAQLAEHTELYYYHFADPETVATISRRNFEPYGLRIEEGSRIYGRDWLYRLILIDE